MNFVPRQVVEDTIESIQEAHKCELAERDDKIARYEKYAKIRYVKGNEKEWRKSTPFLMVYGEHLNQLDLTNSELALLFAMGLHMGFKVKFVRDKGGRKNLNQQGIMNLMRWNNEGYISKLLQSLTAKGAVIRDDNGNDAYYQINPKYLCRGKHTVQTLFTKVFIKPTKKILSSLDTNSMALFLKMATSIDTETNFLVDTSGKKLKKAGIGRLMGRQNRISLKKVVECLEANDVIVKTDNAYMVNPQYIFYGDDMEKYSALTEKFKKCTNGIINVYNQHNSQNGNQPSNQAA